MLSTDFLLLLDDFIEEARKSNYYSVLSYTLKREALSDLVELIKRQYQTLRKSGITIAYPVLTKSVCEAQTFSDDSEENWILQYVYQHACMKCFGYFSKKRAHARQDHEGYLKAQEEQESGRESQT